MYLLMWHNLNALIIVAISPEFRFNFKYTRNMVESVGKYHTHNSSISGAVCVCAWKGISGLFTMKRGSQSVDYGWTDQLKPAYICPCYYNWNANTLLVSSQSHCAQLSNWSYLPHTRRPLLSMWLCCCCVNGRLIVQMYHIEMYTSKWRSW